MAISPVNPATWALGDEITSTQANSIDSKLQTALDKTAAGDTLSGAITVAAGGSLDLSGANTHIDLSATTAKIDIKGNGAKVDASVSGALIRASASGAKIQTASGGRIELGDSDYPTLGAGHTGASRVIAQAWGTHCVPFVSTSAAALSTVGWSVNTGIGRPVTDQPLHFGPYLQTQVVSTTSATFYTYLCRISKLINGATLASVAVNFYPHSGHASVPASTDLPALYIARTRCTTGTLSSDTLKSTATGWQQSTFAGTPSQWNNASGQTITYTPDQYNVIDTAAYDYWAIFADECGPNAIVGTQILSLLMTFTNIADMRSMP